MSQTKRIIATLPKGESIYLYNVDMEAELSAPVVVSGLPTPSTSKAGTVQYRLSHPTSGWFCSIAADDEVRMSQLLQAESGDILLELKPLRSYNAKDVAKAKKFVPAVSQEGGAE